MTGALDGLLPFMGDLFRFIHKITQAFFPPPA